jgi:hypothetical protein
LGVSVIVMRQFGKATMVSAEPGDRLKVREAPTAMVLVDVDSVMIQSSVSRVSVTHVSEQENARRASAPGEQKWRLLGWSKPEPVN